MRAPTLKDVAARAGVGIVTASTVLNGASTTTRVSQTTRQRILDVAAELRYTPNAMARGLRRRRVHTLGVLFDTSAPFAIVQNSHTSGILEGILTTGREAGYNVLMFTCQWSDAQTSASIFRDRLTDGILVVAPRRSSDMVAGLTALDIPLVVVSAPAGDAGVSSVDVDNEAGARLAAEHLVRLGHTRIAYLSGDEEQWSVGQRRNAFWRRLAELGVRRYLDCGPGTFDTNSAREEVRRLLSLPEPPTALFATNDLLAAAALDAARRMGVSVPEQLSIVGFDDAPEAMMTHPQLTTVHHPIVEVGRRATRLLIVQLNDPSSPPVNVLMEPKLIVRGTTGPAPS